MKQQDTTHVIPSTDLDITKIDGNNKIANVDTFISDNVGFFLCCKGSVEIKIFQNKYSIKRGFMLFYFPNMLMKISNASDDLEGYACMSNNYSRIMSIVNNAIPLKTQMSIKDQPCRRTNGKQLKETIHLFNSFITKWNELKNIKENDIKRKLVEKAFYSYSDYCAYKIIYAFIKNEPVLSQTCDRNDLIIQEFFLSLFRNFKEQREVKFYANQRCLSPNYFSAIVKEKTNKPASEWIAQTTINYIENALTATNCSIKELSAELNFPNQSFFGKYFKLRKSMSPLEYRRLMKN